MKGLLFDASSIVYALKSRRVEVLVDNYLQELTVYEVLNALWKEAGLVGVASEESVLRLQRVFSRLVDMMRLVSVHGVEEYALKLALQHRISVYDASYIAVAVHHDLALVTEDRKLRRIAGEYVEALGLDDL